MTTEIAYNKVGIDAKLAAKADLPTGGADGQAIVKAGTTTGWATIGSGGTVADATTTTKGIVQLGGDLTGTAAAPVLKTTLGAGGTVGSSTQIPVLSYDAKGRLTAVAAVTAGGGSIVTNQQTGTAYTLVATDADKVIEQSSGNILTVTIPPNSSVTFPIGTFIEFSLYGSGSIVLVGGTGVTLRSPAGLRVTSQYATAAIRKRGTDEWIVNGMTVA